MAPCNLVILWYYYRTAFFSTNSVLVEFFSCYINNSLEVLSSEILLLYLMFPTPLLSCATRRTYSLDSADLASIKVVLAGESFLFGPMYFFDFFDFG